MKIEESNMATGVVEQVVITNYCEQSEQLMKQS